MIYLAIVLFLFGCEHVATGAGGCDQGWVQFQTSCYKIESHALKQWPDANNACDAQQSHLAIIMTPEENHFVQNELRKLHITDIGMQFWMDGTDKDTEGTWIWSSTGESFEITDWYPGEPNQNAGEEDCLTFFRNYDYHWNDDHCDRLFGYVCEKEMTSVIVVG